LLDRLDSWKSRFGTLDSRQLERMLSAVAARRLRDASSLIRLHETLLFLRAYPCSPEVARLADSILFSFADRITELRAASADLSAFEEPEISGIAGTSLSAVFSYEVARRLALRYPRSLEIAWDRYDEMDRLGPVIWRFLPLLQEDWPVEAHVPYREWISAGRCRSQSDLAWLLEHLHTLPLTPRGLAELYEALQLPLTWNMGTRRTSRSRLRLSKRRLYCHREPLLRRSDVSLERELKGPPLPVRRLSRPEARKMLDLILDTSAMRFRELYGFSHPDESAVFHADAGRGVEIFFFGVPAEWRLPVRAYHAGMFFKNGVPAGYVELLSLFERAEVGFNLYYTFREGESAWLYAQLLRLFRQVLGVNCFSVDPYQIGFENPEAIASGAFWFYRKLGFRPLEPEVARLVKREERRIRQTPGYRSSPPTLERLAKGYVIFEGPSAEAGAWDKFRVRNLGLAVERAMAERFEGNSERFRRAARLHATRHLGVESSSGLTFVLSLIPELPRWRKEEKLAAAEILQAKRIADEARYLHLMQRHPRLRAAFLRLGSAVPAGSEPQ
jgi:hypothetical protein